MANEGNLKPFKKGHDPRRNVKGRIPPMETNELKRLLLKYTNQKVKVGDRIMTKAELIAERVVDDAVRGKLSAIKLLMDRTEGKAPTQAQIMKRQQQDEEKSRMSDAELKRLTELFPNRPTQ
jgi:hypothetical protein